MPLTAQHAGAQFEAGNISEADQICRALLKRNKRDVHAWAILGAIAMQSGDAREAVRCFRRCAEYAPREPRFRVQVGNAEALQGHFDAAFGHYDAALALNPGFRRALEWKAKVFEWAGRGADALELIRPHLDAGRESPDMAEVKGRVDLGADRAGDAAALLERHLPGRDLTDEQRHRLGHLLGRAYEKLKRYDDAFAAHRDANLAVAQGFDPERYARFIDDLTDVFGPGCMETLPRHPKPQDRHVLVSGMPRSGTTLVEQILAAHPDAAGAGEYTGLPEIVHRLRSDLGSEKGYPWCVADMSTADVARFTQRYTSRVPRACEKAARIVNKSLENYKCLGLAALLLPGARVIHCTRDPMDTCLSCYMSDIKPSAMPFITDLRDIGLVYRHYRRLMAHWIEVLDLPVLEVRYEDLVDDLEPNVRRLLEFVDLPFDERCIEYWTSGRAVMTLSYDQVRRPIYRSSVGRHKRYEAHLAPLRDALET